MTDRRDLAVLLPPVEAVDGVPEAALPATALHLAALQARVAARLVAGTSTNGDGDRMLSIDEASASSVGLPYTRPPRTTAVSTPSVTEPST